MIAIAAVVVVLAQQTPSHARDTVAVKGDTARLNPLVVLESRRGRHRYAAPWSGSSFKVAAPLRDTPQSVSVLTGAAIRELSMLSLADAVRYAPGVTMGQGEGHRDAPTIRGNSSTADLFVDGMRDDAQYFRDLYNVERVEVLGGANAMIFGRGGGGGVINRVMKRASPEAVRDATIEGGTQGHARATIDVGGAVSASAAARLNALYQNSETFREHFENRRVGVSSQLAYAPSRSTVARAGVELFQDDRTVDRGIPSFRGAPSAAPLSRFFGNPDSSYATARVAGGDLSVQHHAGDRAQLRARARFARYEKFYQNVFPGSALDAGSSTVTLAAYNSAMVRNNLFTQTEAVVRFPAARMPQTVLVGVEAGRQATENLRKTGFFDGTSTAYAVPFSAPTVGVPVEFRPAADDADNDVVADVASLYAQHQAWLTPSLQATLGARVERFDLRLENHRAPQTLRRRDDLFSPRGGLVYKPVERLSLYSSVAVSHLPSAGDQFSSLTPTTQALEPERFVNREIGIKWDARQQLSLNAALYDLRRSNSPAPSAVSPGATVLTGKQKTTGVELSLNGQLRDGWDVLGAFASQTATIVSATSAAPAGKRVPLVPQTTASLWNRLRLAPRLAVGMGAIHQSSMYAAIDNSVLLPGFWRFDAAAFLTLGARTRLQLNVENLLNETYYATSHGNNNILPGSPRALRASLETRLW